MPGYVKLARKTETEKPGCNRAFRESPGRAVSDTLLYSRMYHFFYTRVRIARNVRVRVTESIREVCAHMHVTDVNVYICAPVALAACAIIYLARTSKMHITLKIRWRRGRKE